MNETMQTILRRRSIRNYKEDQIKDEELTTILEAGSFAPSAMNQQLWHFTVVQNKAVIKKISDALKAVYLKSGNQSFESRAKSDNFTICYNAPTFIIVSVKEGAIAPQYDASLALGNMFLAAESLDIGSCWIHAVNYLFAAKEGEALKNELGIPEEYTPLCSGAFGYKAIGQPSPAPRKEGIINIIK